MFQITSMKPSAIEADRKTVEHRAVVNFSKMRDY